MKSGKETLLALFLTLTGWGYAGNSAAQSPADTAVRYHNESACILPGTHVDTFTAQKFDQADRRSGKSSATILIEFVAADSAPWPQSAKDAVRHAADIWESHISSSVSLHLKAYWSDLGDPLASGGPVSSVSGFEGALPDTRYPLALYRTMTGAPLPPPWAIAHQADFLITINRTKAWSFATDGVPLSGHYDLVSVAMHEIGHGLGFIGTDDYSGSLGGLADPPLIYDRFVHDMGGTALTDTSVYANPSTALGEAITGGALAFTGDKLASTPDGQAALYAPDRWVQGTSYSHLDYTTYPAGSVNSLMNPYSSTAEVQHTPGPLGCDMLSQMGSPLGAACANSLPVELANLEASQVGQVVVVKWITLSEAGNAGFEVQHRSTGESFRKLGFVDGTGSSTEHTNYEFAIPGLAPGLHTFRLKQMDLDGRFDYSSEVEISVAVAGQVYVLGPYPEPFDNGATIDFRVRRSQVVSVDLFDVLGRKVQDVFTGMAHEDEITRVTVAGHALSVGAYVYVIRGKDFAVSGMMHHNK